jgi:hypothetical protein
MRVQCALHAGLLEHAPAACDLRVEGQPLSSLPEDRQSNSATRNAIARRVRIPINSPIRMQRVDFHYIDTLYNPYFAFAMLMAGIDGFHNRLYSIDRMSRSKALRLAPADPTKILSAPSC